MLLLDDNFEDLFKPAIDLVRDRIVLTGVRSIAKAAAEVEGSRSSGQELRWGADLMRAQKLLDLYPEVARTDRFNAWYSQQQSHHENLKALKELEDANLALPYEAKLRNYQRVGALFLFHAGRTICADPLGSGKTIEVIASCDLAKAKRILIVTPASLLYNWEEEIITWSSGTVTVADGPMWYRDLGVREASRWTIISYEALLQGRVPALLSTAWDIMICDEAHRLKNRKALRTQGAYKLGELASRTILITGTPLLNNAQELWSLLHLLYPKRFSSYWAFVEQFCLTESTPWGTKIVGAKNTSLLREMLGSLMIRREPSILKELPPLVSKKVLLKMGERQSKLYKELEKEAIARFESGEELAVGSFVALLLRLRQLTLSPRILDQSEPLGVKLEAAVELIQDWTQQGHKVVVFSWFKPFVYLLKTELEKLKIGVVVATGSETAGDRHEAVSKFQADPKIQVFAGTIAAMSEGVTLTAADVVLLAEKSWVPAQNDQAIARVYRLTQKKSVLSVSLQCVGSVDERLEEVLLSKKLLINEVLVTRAVLERMAGQHRKEEEDVHGRERGPV